MRVHGFVRVEGWSWFLNVPLLVRRFEFFAADYSDPRMSIVFFNSACELSRR